MQNNPMQNIDEPLAIIKQREEVELAVQKSILENAKKLEDCLETMNGLKQSIRIFDVALPQLQYLSGHRVYKTVTMDRVEKTLTGFKIITADLELHVKGDINELLNAK
jgi:hypothetical protein